MKQPVARWGWQRFGAVALVLTGLAGCGRNASRGPIGDEERQRIPGVVAFVSERGNNKDVWLVRPTGEETQLSRGAEDEFPAAPSPRGDAMLVVAARDMDGVHREQLRLVPMDGSEAVPLHPPQGRARNPSWAPDGTWFVAESDARGGFSDLVRMSPRAAPVWLATAPQGNFEPSVSPDGKHIAFVSSRDGNPEIYIMDANPPGDMLANAAEDGPGDEPAANAKRLTAFHKEDGAPAWSPDGRWIAFLSNREGRERIFLVRPDGTDTHALSGTANTGYERDIAWSPDGRKLAFVGGPKDGDKNHDGKRRIWVASVDGGEPIALTDGTSRDDQPVWSPDGKYLAFVSERKGDADIYLMRADGSGQTRLTHARGADWLPRWVAAK